MIEETHKLFPILVKKYSGFLTEKQCKDAVVFLSKTENFEKHRYLDGNAGTSYNMLKNHLFIELENNVKGFENITKRMNDLLVKYCDESNIVRVKINNCWCNIQNPGSILANHNHGLSIAGALYLNTDEKSSKIFFTNPNPYVDFMFIEQYGEYNFQHYWFQPQIGDLLLFPGWLTHGSNKEQNQTEGRMSISFNADPEL